MVHGAIGVETLGVLARDHQVHRQCRHACGKPPRLRARADVGVEVEAPTQLPGRIEARPCRDRRVLVVRHRSEDRSPSAAIAAADCRRPAASCRARVRAASPMLAGSNPSASANAGDRRASQHLPSWPRVISGPMPSPSMTTRRIGAAAEPLIGVLMEFRPRPDRCPASDPRAPRCTARTLTRPRLVDDRSRGRASCHAFGPTTRSLSSMQERTSQQASIHEIRALPSDLMNLHEIVAKARQNLNQNDWDYIVGGVESETTLRRNRMALDAIAFRPRVLRDVSGVDATVRHFGRTLRLPVVLAPVGSLESFHTAGAEPVVRGTGEFGVGHMLSFGLRPRARGSRQGGPRCAAALPVVCPRRRGMGRRSRRPRHRSTAMPRSRSPSIPPITAGASATSPSAS